MRHISLAGTFPKKVKHNRLVEYCEYFGLDLKEAAAELRDRGYSVRYA